MSVYTPVGYFISIMLFLAFVLLPTFARADRPWHTENDRTTTIDGLRGFLAIGVFFHHALIYHNFLEDGHWSLPPSTFYTQLGQGSVTLFFMITGYLFWGKIVASDRRMNWVGLYIGRVFRIGPMYFLSMIFMLLIIFWSARFALIDPWTTVMRQIAPLSALGWFTPGGRINGYEQPWVLIAGVTWTLQYEWKFYLFVLPISALIAKMFRAPLVLPLVGLLYFLARQHWYPTLSNFGFAAFFVGMTCAALRTRAWIGIQRKRSDFLASLLLTALLILLSQQGSAYTLHVFPILAAIFLLVSAGASLFGLLLTRAARRLGEISYGIYILQGLALFSILGQPWVKQQILSSPLAYWCCIVMAGLILISVAMLAHIALEKPGIELGRKIAARVSRVTLGNRTVKSVA
jgi:peptidoglycan/LPS O-acetylase OafA/YrhL